jgi:predicted ATPase
LRPPGLEEELLPAIAIYGANASGKTNVLLALAFMRNAVAHSHRLWEPEAGVPREPFALSETKNECSSYEVDAFIAGVRYRYGFALSSEKVEKEWLHAWPNGRKQTWFEREGATFEFGRLFQGENETIRGLTRENSLFLSAGAQNNHPALLPIFRWFRELTFEDRRARPFGIRPYGVSQLMQSRMFEELFSRQSSLFLDDDDPLSNDREAIVRLLQAADTGIVDVRVDRAPDEPRGRTAPRVTLFFKHKTSDPESAWLPMDVESAGTVALLDLAIRLVPTLRTGGILCVDEIESSLHPMLAGALLRLFCNRETNANGAQLIFTTHDTNLLGNVLGVEPLRRDQIWFTEKDESGASHLYPLTDFHPRREENLERGYLQGRYGAVPFLGDLVSSRMDE